MRTGLSLLVLAVVGLFSWACGQAPLAACGDEPDVTGTWHLHLSAAPGDAGVAATIADTVEVTATLEQAGPTDFLGLGRYVYGSLRANDPRYFSVLEIPRLVHNDGSKSGAILGCRLSLNVPIASPVSDDDMPQGPMRIALVGKVTAPGTLLGQEGSRLLLESEPGAPVRDYAWTGMR